MAPLPDIHGFKWVQLSPNQCQTRCHYVVHYAWNGMHFIYLYVYIYIYINTYKYICHMGSHKMKVADSALYVKCASGVIFLISPYFLCDISHITPLGSPRQIMVTHQCDKTLNTWQHTQIWGIPSAVLIALSGLHPSSAIKTALGIYPISRLLPCINYYIMYII